VSYLTFEEYQELGGTIEEEELFDDLEFGAEAYINYMTFDRLKAYPTIPTEVKRLTYYLITLVKKKAESLSLGSGDVSTGSYIRNQSNDGVSITYSGMASADLYKTCTVEANIAVKHYLSGVKDASGRKVLYRGLYPGE